jgi:hypothetical protein
MKVLPAGEFGMSIAVDRPAGGHRFADARAQASKVGAMKGI